MSRRYGTIFILVFVAGLFLYLVTPHLGFTPSSQDISESSTPRVFASTSGRGIEKTKSSAVSPSTVVPSPLEKLSNGFSIEELRLVSVAEKRQLDMDVVVEFIRLARHRNNRSDLILLARQVAEKDFLVHAALVEWIQSRYETEPRPAAGAKQFVPQVLFGNVRKAD